MNISDIIMNEIISAMGECGSATFRRNEFAEKVGCVPSQINYVITSRFTPEKGYIVRSKRGGGGSVTITKINYGFGLLMHIINSVGASMDENSARVILENLYLEGEIDEKTMNVIFAAVCDITLKEIPSEMRDSVRASIFKNSLLSYIRK
jgi:transcriptional regulator CtsR